MIGCNAKAMYCSIIPVLVGIAIGLICFLIPIICGAGAIAQ